MKKLVGIFSLCFLASSNLFAATYLISKLSDNEKMNISLLKDTNIIQYDESTDEIIIDEKLDKELRSRGILTTEKVEKGTACTGGGDF